MKNLSYFFLATMGVAKKNYVMYFSLFFVISLCLANLSFAQNIDSLQEEMSKRNKSLVKIQYNFNRPNRPWLVPNGIKYERILGKNTTYEIGTTVELYSTSVSSYGVCLAGELRYYFRKPKNTYTFKGFFVRGGLMYNYYEAATMNYVDQTGGLLLGVGYQFPIYKKLHFETTICTNAGFYSFDSKLFNIKYTKLDAFRWGEFFAFKFGYAF